MVQSYTEGHPDKVCDQIADALLDEYLRRDPESRVDLSVMGSHGMLAVGGTVQTEADFDAGELARQVYKDIGYEDEIEPFVNIDTRPKSESKNSSDGTVFVHGYATRETREMLPLPVVLVNMLARRIDETRKQAPGFSWIKPDGKIQLLMDGKAIKGVTILLQHEESVDHHMLQEMMINHVVEPILGKIEHGFVSINPIGCFSQGGLGNDAGASNRKIFSDTYGGIVPFGSSALSGKDPGRIERAGAYMARFVAKSLVREGVCDNVLVRLAYSLGKRNPVLVEARTGAGQDLSEMIESSFDFSRDGIIKRLDLQKPIYRATANYGHFGKDGLPWEEPGV